MPFGVGIGELLTILLIVVVVFGASDVPGLQASLGHRLRAAPVSRPRPRLLLRRRSHWTRSDWALVVLAAVMATAAFLLRLA